VTLKRLLATVMLLCLAVSLCACSGEEPATTTTVVTTAPTVDTTPSETPTQPFDGYTVKVVDEGGNPVAGVLVQLCLDNCFPSMTDASGVATFDVEEADYKVSFVSIPEGYELASEVQEFYFEDDAKEMELTLKAVS